MTRSPPIALITAAHTLIRLSIRSSMVYVLGAGLAGRSVAIAGAVGACESMIFAANGFRCPLTDLAESHGADRGSVTGLYLPAWFARNLPAIHLPIVLLAIVLHRRNVRRRHSEPVPATFAPGPRVTHRGRTGPRRRLCASGTPRYRERRLHSRGDLLAAIDRTSGLVVEDTHAFRYPRSSTSERLQAQAEGRHYSTFSLYAPDELAAAIVTFLARLPGAEASWVDESLLLVAHRAPLRS